MSSGEPENYQFHRTQTPESPRPIYPPEPSNIPLLKNQNDPAMTDASTYNIRTSSQLHAVDQSGAQEVSIESIQNATEVVASGMPSLSGDTQGQAAINASTNQTQPSGFRTVPNEDNTQTAYQQSMPGPQSDPFPHPDIQLSKTLEALSSSGANFDASHDASFPANHTAFDQAVTESTIQGPETAPDSLGPKQKQEASQMPESLAEGVNYQSLLENLTRSTSAAPAIDHSIASRPIADSSNDDFARGSEMQAAAIAGLPRRPPPNVDAQSMPEMNASASTSQTYPYQTGNPAYNASLPPIPISGNAPGTTTGPNGLPPPPGVAFMRNNNESRQAFPVNVASHQGSTIGSDDEEHKWGPEVQRKYDQFLADERTYVTEGVWDKFPLGSRMFVGNLPTEKVTKRDLYHIFHKYGKLAQISIKQAYGFVQFLEAGDCAKALQVEQGVTIRGRRLHLEISKPQKNTRNAGQGDGLRQAARKRSRSPERRGSRRGPDRLPYSDYRDEPGRRRDEYRPGKGSASPRSFRQRDDHRLRDGNRDRSRSPYARSAGRRRSPTPPSHGYSDEANLTLPRRHQNSVPDIQIIILDDVDRNFISYLENGLRSRGLSCESLDLNSHLPLAAVVKRQIIEGVQAIVKLTRSSQYNGKVPLQVFDRSMGTEVKFNEYVDLDIAVAAEVVLQNKRNQQATLARPHSQYGAAAATPAWGQPSSLPFSQPGNSSDPNVASMISNLDGPALQKLLSAMQQQGPAAPPQHVLPAVALGPQTLGVGDRRGGSHGNNPDLASLLTSVARQQQQHQQPSQVQVPFSPTAPQGYGQNMQHIMDQLGHFRR